MDSVIKECKIHGLCQHNVDKNGKINSMCSIAANVSDCQSEERGSIPPHTASEKRFIVAYLQTRNLEPVGDRPRGNSPGVLLGRFLKLKK